MMMIMIVMIIIIMNIIMMIKLSVKDIYLLYKYHCNLCHIVFSKFAISSQTKGGHHTHYQFLLFDG